MTKREQETIEELTKERDQAMIDFQVTTERASMLKGIVMYLNGKIEKLQPREKE